MKDKCVVCGKETQYDKDTPIKDRSYYVEGGGQLCPLCFIETYKKGDRHECPKCGWEDYNQFWESRRIKNGMTQCLNCLKFIYMKDLIAVTKK